MTDENPTEIPAFSRTATKNGCDTVELRIDIPAELARRIDALMMVNRLKARADYVVPELTRAVDEEFHRATVLLRCAGINPLASITGGKAAE
jgi:hypothetical protein